MTIQVTKEPINLREKLNELETSKGLKGNEILQAETAQEVRSLIGAGRKNLIINGGFDVWQRGTSGTKTAVSGWPLGYIASDRWHNYGNNTTQTKSNSTVNGKLVNTLKIAGTSTNKLLIQAIENGSAILSGQDCTLSFYMRATTTSESVVLAMRFGTSLAGDTGNLVLDTITTNTSWTKYVINFNITDPSVNTTRTAMLRFENTLEDYEIAQVQLELGSVATDFEHRSYGEELALCQRFYQQWLKFDTVPAIRYSTAAGSPFFSLPYWLKMRASPTVSHSGTWRGTNGFSGVNTASPFESHIRVELVDSVSANACNYLESYPDGKITADAEL